jgi:hypothetical protein
MNQSLHLTKDRFAWIIFSCVILSAFPLDVNNISCYTTTLGRLPIQGRRKRGAGVLEPPNNFRLYRQTT